jgi:hypothetical protein
MLGADSMHVEASWSGMCLRDGVTRRTCMSALWFLFDRTSTGFQDIKSVD